MRVHAAPLGLLAMGWLVVGFGIAPVRAEEPADGAKLEFFEKKVRPTLVNHCHACHAAETKPSGGLRVDDRNGLLTGGVSGAAVIPGKAKDSLLIRRVTHADVKRKMPLEGKHLTEAQVADLAKWIDDGAAWPPLRLPATLGQDRPRYERLRREHWAWQPLADPMAPAVVDAAWPLADLDRFVLAKLEARQLKPVGDADKVAWIRRATFDLTGLPPTPAEIDAFQRDMSPTAHERVVDRLLGSPGFGERWGRHWLDVARYGESTGPSRNIPYPHAWKYRDYVLDAFDRDVPFDQFVREQVAGDLLPAVSPAQRDRMLTATGFLALGVKDVNQRFKVRFDMDNVDEQIDVVCRAVLGLTVSCARCHDHKFDPIPTTDYYALAGIFTSTDNCAGVRNKMGGGGLDYYDPAMLVRLGADLPPTPAEHLEKLKADVAQAKKEWDAIRGTPEGTALAANGQPKQRPIRLRYEQLQGELTALLDPAARGSAVHGARDAKVVGDTQVRIRGEAEKVGPTVPRGFLGALPVSDVERVNANQSGRLELAAWLTSRQNPLTPRVVVNRAWQRLFGRGIVSTVDNFGVMGDAPTHPELLDHLAQQFLRDGWSMKKLVRTLVLSRTYRLSAEASPAQLAADPANRLLWRHTPRRLEAEEIRDAMLASAGRLNRQRPAGSPAQVLKMVEMRDNGPEANSIHSNSDKSLHRSVYLPLLRGVTPSALEAFDPVEQTLVTGARDGTTTPGQALYMLNSAFVRKQALHLAESVLTGPSADDSERLVAIHRIALGRAPSGAEIERARSFLTNYEAAHRIEPPATPMPKPVVGKSLKSVVAASGNPDAADQTGNPTVEDAIQAKDARTAAWFAYVQSVFASAEFRYLK